MMNAGGVVKDQVERLLYLPFGKGIYAGSGLIQDEYSRVLDQHPQQRNELALAHREPRSTLPDFRVQAVGQ